MESNRSVQVSRPNRNFLSPFFGFVDWMSFCRGRVKWFRLFRLHRCMSFLDFLPPPLDFLFKKQKKRQFWLKTIFGPKLSEYLMHFRVQIGLEIVFFWFRCCLIYFLISFSYFAIWLFYILGVWCAMLWWCLPISTPCSSGSVFLSPNQTSPFFHQPPNPKWRCNTQQLSRTETSLYPWQPQLAIGLQLSVSKKQQKNQQKRNFIFTTRPNLSNSL
jgi:hypothetical protein